MRWTAAASPAAVPLPFTDASAVDPEEAYVAAIASCHLLSFLPLAALAGFEVLRYEDDAVAAGTDWNKSFDDIRQVMLETFATTYSRALQESLYAMGSAVLAAHPEVAEIKFSAPNKHHFLYNLETFGVENNNEVFHADDRPYGLIQATVMRDDAPDAGPAWTPAANLA